MIQAYADDSTHSQGERRLYLAAYSNSVDNWIAFSNEWKAALTETPSIKYAKMSEAESLQGQFKGWRSEDRDAKVLKLAKLIRKYDPVSIHTSVSTAECAKVMSGRVPHGMARPYLICFQALVIHLAQFHAMKGLTVPVDFVFDEQGGVGQEAALLYPWLRESLPPEVRAMMGTTPIFRNDKDVAALQAADLLAWHVRRWREGVDPLGARPAFDYLIADQRHVYVEVEGKTLAKLARGLSKIPGTNETRHKANWLVARRELAAYLDAGLPPPDTSLWRMRIKYGQRSIHRFYQRARRAWKELTRS